MAGTQVARRPDGTLLPGSVINPGGRPKGLAAKVRQLVDLDGLIVLYQRIARGEAIRVGGELGHLEVPTIRDMMAAGSWLADRGWGLPQVNVAISEAPSDERFNAEALSRSERDDLERLLARAAGENVDAIDAEIVGETPALTGDVVLIEGDGEQSLPVL